MAILGGFSVREVSGSMGSGFRLFGGVGVGLGTMDEIFVGLMR